MLSRPHTPLWVPQAIVPRASMPNHARKHVQTPTCCQSCSCPASERETRSTDRRRTFRRQTYARDITLINTTCVTLYCEIKENSKVESEFPRFRPESHHQQQAGCSLTAISFVVAREVATSPSTLESRCVSEAPRLAFATACLCACARTNRYFWHRRCVGVRGGLLLGSVRAADDVEPACATTGAQCTRYPAAYVHSHAPILMA